MVTYFEKIGEVFQKKSLATTVKGSIFLELIITSFEYNATNEFVRMSMISSGLLQLGDPVQI